MKLAITIATYQRADGRTSFYLKRALDSIFCQTHKNFKVFLIGDHYENDEELREIISLYNKDQLYCGNLAFSPERIKYKNQEIRILWCSAGLTAIHTAIDKALEEGFDYICHLDHDDYWREDHLELINQTIEETNADWLCTKAEYGKDLIYPETDSIEKLIPFLPLSHGTINSSTCYNYRTIPLRYRNVYEETEGVFPSDADLWIRSAEYIIQNNLKSLLINQITCFHHEEGYLLNAD